ncbi:MAG: glycine/sarcosine/betaine reductase component B subunit [Gammaproteobacteria bacterium]
MALTLKKLMVHDLAIGRATTLCDGRLTVNAADLKTFLRERHPGIDDVEVGVARPGEATRILCCKDVIQPSTKLSGSRPGEGARLVLEGVGVVTCGPIVGFQEGIIDMSGRGAECTPFSTLNLVVLEIRVVGGLSPADHEALLRAAGLDAADHVSRACADIQPQTSEPVLWDEVDPPAGLPRIACVYMVLSQGLLHDTYLMGKNAAEGLPLALDPRVVIDAGLVSGNCVSACDKNTTYHHRNSPVVAELLAGHGTRWNFAGMVVTNAATRLAGKERSATAAIELVRELKANAAIVTKEGFGNPDADFMMLLGGLEAAGVKSVGITDEFAGTDGASQSLADATPRADAIVSTGNANERILLPPMQTVLGPLPDASRLAGGYPGSLKKDGSIEVELQAIMGATNELGFSRLSCREI